jgi:hypothetical protein
MALRGANYTQKKGEGQTGSLESRTSLVAASPVGISSRPSFALTQDQQPRIHW